MQTASARSANELSALDAARLLNVDLNRLYNLLRLGRIEGRKDVHTMLDCDGRRPWRIRTAQLCA